MCQVEKLFLFFLAWAFVSTFTEGLRYGFDGWYEVNFGLLKLGKFALYAVSGWLTALLVRGPRDLDRLLWALTAGGLATTLALPFAVPGTAHPVYDSVRGFKATNAVSVEVAILIAFLGVAWASGWGGRRWRTMAPWVLGVMTVGFTFSRGRGGWLAAAIGLLWFLYRGGLMKRKSVVVTLILAGATILAYQNVPTFRRELAMTVHPDPKHLARYNAGFMGIDEGARLETWAHEGAKLIDAPILGRGFYNRFRGSGLWWTGSHNFWLQMILETGIPGGAVVLAMVWLLWRESRRRSVLSVEVALLVSFVGGMGGEYFYGGMPLFALIISCTPLRVVSARPMAATQKAGVLPGDIPTRLNPREARG
jgi:O-antigen ligase